MPSSKIIEEARSGLRNVGVSPYSLQTPSNALMVSLHRAVAAKRISEAEFKEIAPHLLRHASNPTWAVHVAKVEKRFLQHRNPVTAFREVAELANRKELPRMRVVRGLLASLGLAAGIVGVGTGVATGIVSRLEAKDKRPPISDALRNVIRAELELPSALSDTMRGSKTKKFQRSKNLTIPTVLSVSRRDSVPFQDPRNTPLLPVPRGASSLFTWMQSQTPGIRGKLLSHYPAPGQGIVPSLIVEEMMQKTSQGIGVPIAGWDPQGQARRFAKLFASDEGRKQRLMMLLDLHRHFLPWTSKQGFPSPEDVDGRLAKLTAIHTPTLPSVIPPDVTKSDANSQVPSSTTQQAQPSQSENEQNALTPNASIPNAPMPSSDEFLGPALPAPVTPKSGLDHETIQTLARHYSSLGDDYAGQRNYNRAIQLKQMALRLLNEHLDASSDADAFAARRSGNRVSLEQMRSSQTWYLEKAIEEYEKKMQQK